MAEITSLTSVLKGNITLSDYFVVANSSTKKARRLQVQSMFASLVTTGTGGESLYSSITNSNQLNFKGIKSADTTKFTVTTVSDSLQLTLVESGIDLSACDNSTSGFLSTVDLSLASGSLAISRGGTGLNSIAKGSILYASDLDTISTFQLNTNGNLLIGNATSGKPSLGTLKSSDSSITITNGAGTIDLKAASTSALKTTLDCSTYNINLNDSAGDSFLSGDGTAEGVHVDSNGYVFIGDNVPTIPTLASQLTLGGSSTTALTLGNVNNYAARTFKFQDAAGTNAGLDGTIRGADGSGTNQAGGDVIIQAGSGTNTTGGGTLALKGGGNSGSSGVGGAVTLSTFNASNTEVIGLSVAATTGELSMRTSATFGTGADLTMGSGAIKPGSGGLWRPTPVVLADSTPTTLTIAANCGRTNVIVDLTATTTYNIPTPTAAGQYYHFIYGGAAADGHNVLLRTVTTDNSVYFKGAITHLDQTADENCEAAFADGDSNELLTIATPRVVDVHFLALSTTVWYVWGHVCSATAPAFAD